MRKYILFLSLALTILQVKCYNEFLRGAHPLYGISTMLDGLNTSCYEELDELRRAVEEEKVWALKALDASGQPSTGFLYGNNLWLGSHAQCLDISNRRKLEVRNDKIEHLETPYDYPPVPMSFAVVYFEHNSTIQYHTRMPLERIIQIGMCLPSTCSESDIKNLSQKYVNGNHMEFQSLYNVSLEVTYVRKLNEDPFWILQLPKTIILLVITAAFICLAIFGTVCDVKEHNIEKKRNLALINYNTTLADQIRTSGTTKVSSVQAIMTNSNLEETRSNPSLLLEILKCFSVYSNIKSFLRTKLSSDSLPIIYGIRFFGMAWVISVHVVYFEGDFLTNVPMGYRQIEGFFTQIFTNSTYCVDTFLVLRLTPTYMVILLVTDVSYTYFSQSSALLTREKNEIICEQYWWRNLLYINNLYPRSEMCMSWSWYLSLDTQFYTIGSFLLLLSTTYFKLSAIILVLMILINVAATAYKSYSIGYIPTLDDQMHQLDAIYDLPWNRIAPYLIGIITAYLLIVKLQNKLHLKERTRLILWVIFPSINLWVIFAIYTRQISVEFSAFYMAVSRALWAIGLSWVLIACNTGNARLLEKFLSFRGYIPLSRLTYCAYLLNPLVVTFMTMAGETPDTGSIAKLLVQMAGMGTITFLVSFVFSMLFESPIIRLTKLMFERLTPKKRENPSVPNDVQERLEQNTP